MRKNWFSAPVAAAVAAPFLIALNAHVALAQDGTSPSGDAAVTTTTSDVVTTATTTPPAEEGAPLGTGASNLDSAAPDLPGELVDDLPEVDGLEPLAATGDDALPSLQQSRNNPYLRANTAGMTSGRTSGDQEFGAFLPPTVTETVDVNRDANQELVNVLGSEVYNRRVNISTPPDTEVEEVVRILAERAELNFVYGEGVIQGKITLNLRDVPLGVALQSLLSAQDLAIVREGTNVMRIARRQDVKPGAKVDMQTVYIKLNWVQADTLAKTLGATIHDTGGKIQPHPESNTLIISESAPNVAMLRDLVAQLDVPEKQVMIEARMVELVLKANRGLGSSLNISKVDGSGSSPIITGDGTAIEGLLSSLAAGGSSLSFGGTASILGSSFNIGAALDGLEERNVVHTLANPRIITLNNQIANIEITRDIPYVEDGQGPTQGSTIQNVQFKQSSVRLNVLPVITNNGYVRMRLEPMQEILNGFANFSGTGPTQGSGGTQGVPIIDTRRAVTNVIVKDEDTVVLGGLRQISASDTKQEFPWLAKAPVLGWFFKRDIKQHDKNDLMLFVTPHIVKAPQLTAAENYKYTRIDAHWDLPDYFFDDSVDQREGRHRFEADMDARNYYPHDLLLPAPEEAVDNSYSSAGGYTSAGERMK